MTDKQLIKDTKRARRTPGFIKRYRLARSIRKVERAWGVR